MTRRLARVGAGMALLAACTQSTGRPSALFPTPRRVSAAELLATVPVKGRSPKTGYARSQFGPAWADVNRNGCDTRNDILNRDLDHRRWRSGTHGCVVLEGDLTDPYTAAPVHFTKASASRVQIDHIVALSDAWQKGARDWDAGKRRRFANDPLNLLAVEARVNAAKGISDAASWLPPSHAFRCEFVARQITVKAAWGLWVTRAEHDQIARVLAACPGQPAATSHRPGRR